MPISLNEPLFVPIRLPGEEEDSWVDLYEDLNHNNLIFCFGVLDAELANEIIALMLYLGMEDNTQSLYLLINSPVGDIMHGIAVDNVMQYVRSPVMTICAGIAASIASYILAGGAKKKRVAYPHARIRIHQPSVKSKKYKDKDKDKDEDKDKDKDKDEDGYENKKKKKKKKKKSVKEIWDTAAELLTLRETLARGYSERTEKTLWAISQDMERGINMSAREAQAYRIIDRILD